ncbi:MAG: hypothetical protein ACI8XO_000680 [Verrucomicrobiales bacterium]
MILGSGLDRRRRLWIAATCLVVVVIGLASRSRVIPMPAFFVKYAGDTLWAVLVFLLLAFLRPRFDVLRLAGGALVIAFGVELLQLYQAPWLNSIRDTLPGRLVLGQGFLFSDLILYMVGIGSAAILYQWMTEKTFARASVICAVGFALFMIIVVIACNVGHGQQLFSMMDQVPGRDKTGHFVLMGMLSFLLVIMLVPRMKSDRPKAALIVMAVVALVITLEEGSQYFISSRTFSLADLGCSLAGVIAFGAIAYVFVRK